MTGRRALPILLTLLGLAVPTAAHAGERYALVVGANTGDADDGTLAYAERDAQRVADVLVRLGGVAPETLLLFVGPDGPGLERALQSFGGRIQQSADDGGPVLFVYYSGHADAQSLHLSGTRLPFRTLRARVDALSAEVSVFIVDA